MAKGWSVDSYLTQVSQLKYKLFIVGEVISNLDLVRISLKGFTKEWEFFMKCMVG
jgi:hypothetical protein